MRTSSSRAAIAVVSCRPPVTGQTAAYADLCNNNRYNNAGQLSLLQPLRSTKYVKTARIFWAQVSNRFWGGRIWLSVVKWSRKVTCIYRLLLKTESGQIISSRLCT
jgi:hypothetical protein